MNELSWQLLEERAELESVRVGGVEVKQGDRVRLSPRRGGDIFDIALAGKTAIVVKRTSRACGEPRERSIASSSAVKARDDSTIKSAPTNVRA